RTTIRKDASMPMLPKAHGTGRLSDFEEVEPRDWLTAPVDVEVKIQTLHQREEFAMTLLMLAPEADDRDDGDDGLEDAFDRFSRF
ncbi:MAG: hypothetical protein J0H19_14815, partial [Rhodospirillales bacterium]|nr:hypothetical protein [Rhodospirillales bacterium]